jgi:Family of unknown function (DUF6428)
MPLKVYTYQGMYISQFKHLLVLNPDNHLSITLPDGKAIPADFHVTEVGHVARRFVDCGGTIRSLDACLLQVWVAANDKDHRLTAGKLAAILDLAKPLLPSAEVGVEVEYGEIEVSQFLVSTVVPEGTETRITLENKHTDCLAREACGLESGCCA